MSGLHSRSAGSMCARCCPQGERPPMSEVCQHHEELREIRYSICHLTSTTGDELGHREALLKASLQPRAVGTHTRSTASAIHRSKV